MTVRDLPTLNAILNSTATVLLVYGWTLIRARRIEAHRRVMTAAFCVSVSFLISYLVYHAQVPPTRFQGTGAVRLVYIAVLMTHTTLAAIVPFLAIVTLWRGWTAKYDKHRRIARWTLPIWLYVSVTGVIIYWMLYRL